MAKGAESKLYVIKKILEIFPEAFQYDKEIRIPMDEDGENIQIKVSLTCAKTNVSVGSDNAVPTKEVKSESESKKVLGMKESAVTEKIEATEQEKQAVADLMAALGI